MGLVMAVGALAEELGNDDDEDRAERVASVRSHFVVISRVLKAANSIDHEEPEVLPTLNGRPLWEVSCESFPYRTIHYLRRFQARLLNRVELPALAVGEAHDDPAGDRFVRQEYERGRSHLVCHSDCEGYYVPVRFAEPICDEDLLGRTLGSSIVLHEELLRLADPLGLPIVDGVLPAEFEELIRKPEGNWPWRVERLAWLALYRNTTLSIAHSTAIRFS